MRDVLTRNGIDARKVRVSLYSTNVSQVTKMSATSPSPDKPRIAYIGSIAPHKGVEVVVKAFLEIPKSTNTTLKIYGDASRDPAYFERLQQMVRGDGRVSFEGPFESERIGHVLAEVDALVVPSLWYENTPLVVYEAMAARTPVVGTDLGSISEVVDHGRNGLLFRRGDVRDLSDQLIRLISEPGLLELLRSGTSPVRTISDSVDELEEIYEDLIRAARSEH